MLGFQKKLWDSFSNLSLFGSNKQTQSKDIAVDDSELFGIETKIKKDKIDKKNLVEQFLVKRRCVNYKNMQELDHSIQSYKKHASDQEKFFNDKESFTEISEFICPICIDYICVATTTSCGHTFCNQCLFESLLVQTSCPLCRTKTYKTTNMISMDVLIKNHLAKIKDKNILKSYKTRLEATKKWQKNKRLKKAEVGMTIDVRDTEHIWCIGEIVEKIKNKKHAPTLKIHYVNWNKLFDEYICMNSQRLAPHGFFTSRKDIPRYDLHQNSDAIQSYVIGGSNNNNANQNQFSLPSIGQPSFINSTQPQNSITNFFAQPSLMSMNFDMSGFNSAGWNSLRDSPRTQHPPSFIMSVNEFTNLNEAPEGILDNLYLRTTLTNQMLSLMRVVPAQNPLVNNNIPPTINNNQFSNSQSQHMSILINQDIHDFQMIKRFI